VTLKKIASLKTYPGAVAINTTTDPLALIEPAQTLKVHMT
jgi:hypothetical protein